MLLVVDFAAVHSAAVVMDSLGVVHHQFDSWGKDIGEFTEETAFVAAQFDVRRAVFEDVPFGIGNQFQTKPVLRGQGMVIREFDALGIGDDVRWLSPSTWQRSKAPEYVGVWKGGTKGARAAAARFGYEPPNLLETHAGDIPEKAPENTKERARIRAKLRKAMTDYDDAYLMGRFLAPLSIEEIDELTQPSSKEN